MTLILPVVHSTFETSRPSPQRFFIGLAASDVSGYCVSGLGVHQCLLHAIVPSPEPVSEGAHHPYRRHKLVPQPVGKH